MSAVVEVVLRTQQFLFGQYWQWFTELLFELCLIVVLVDDKHCPQEGYESHATAYREYQAIVVKLSVEPNRPKIDQLARKEDAQRLDCPQKKFNETIVFFNVWVLVSVDCLISNLDDASHRSTDKITKLLPGH